MILIQTAITMGIPYHVLPGATALIPALVQSGFSTDDWCFVGFPPHKKGRDSFINALNDRKNVVILYESPYRILDLFNSLQSSQTLNARQYYVVRELTKKFEQSFRGNPTEILQLFTEQNAKGEFVIVIDKENI
jgi:16S rRNA (cytidine1402-2'-O)-methyltransferase